jgi:hypothetical protein
MAVFDIPSAEIRRVHRLLKKPGDSAVISGYWAPSDDVEPVSTLLVIQRVEGGYFVTPMGVGEADISFTTMPPRPAT